MPWSEAVDIFGEEASLEAHLRRPDVVQDLEDKTRASTLSKYRDKGVPIQEIGERVLDRLGSGFRLPQDDQALREVIDEVRKLFGLPRDHDWRVLRALLDLPVSHSGKGVRAGRS